MKHHRIWKLHLMHSKACRLWTYDFKTLFKFKFKEALIMWSIKTTQSSPGRIIGFWLVALKVSERVVWSYVFEGRIPAAISHLTLHLRSFLGLSVGTTYLFSTYFFCGFWKQVRKKWKFFQIERNENRNSRLYNLLTLS